MMVRRTSLALSRRAWAMLARRAFASFRKRKLSSRLPSRRKGSCSRRCRASAWGRAKTKIDGGARRAKKKRALFSQFLQENFFDLDKLFFNGLRGAGGHCQFIVPGVLHHTITCGRQPGCAQIAGAPF